MGLINNETLPNGVGLEYWRIVSLTIITNEQCVIEVAGYTSKEKRDEEQEAIAHARETGEWPELDVFIETKFINIEYDPDLSVNKAYELLKGMEEFSGATDVIENWAAETSYYTDDLAMYGETVYQCIQAHMSQEGWEPPNVPSLWKEYQDPSVIPEWVQPTGAADAYAKGDKVKHNDKTWVSVMDANVWEPGVYGWDEI